MSWRTTERLTLDGINTTTRTHPRRLEDAFGPHTSREIHTEPEPLGWRVCDAFVAALLVAVLAAVAAGVL